MSDYLKAKNELILFLEMNPQLKDYQKELEIAMDKVGDDPYKRFQVYNFFLNDNLMQLKSSLDDLTVLLKRKDN